MGETRHKKHGKKPEKTAQAGGSTSQQFKGQTYSYAAHLSPSQDTASAVLISTSEYPRSYFSPKIEVRDMGDRGFGVVTTKNVKAGELLLLEVPLAHLSSQEDAAEQAAREVYIRDQVAELPKDIRKAYRKLCDTQKDGFSKLMSIFYSNCYDLQHYGNGACLGQVASRINHSCSPNVCFSFAEHLPHGVLAAQDEEGLQQRKEAGYMIFHAIKAIGRNKELLSNYESIWLPPRRRRQALRTYYDFDCDCPACRPQDSFWERSDQRRERMMQLKRSVEVRDHDHQSRPGGTRILHAQNIACAREELENLVKLMLNESLVGGHDLANIYRDLVTWSLRASTAAEADVLQAEQSMEVALDEAPTNDVASHATAGLEIARKAARGANRAAQVWLEQEREVCVRSFGRFGRRTLAVKPLENIMR